jgi:ABC-type uncharacterized transport system substrate-binding protein
MTRRSAMTLLAGAGAAFLPPLARAQQRDKVFRVGFLGVTRDAPGTGALYDMFIDELKENGFSEGRNLMLDFRQIDDPRGAPAVGAELVQMAPDVIVAQGPETALKAVLDAKSRVPIVFQAINYDPVERGYVASVARPGGIITGVFFRQPELAAKKVELLAQAFPERKHLAILWDSLVEDEFERAARAAGALNLELYTLKLENPPYDFDAAFRSIGASGAKMVLVLSSPFFARFRREIAASALRQQLPSMFLFRSYVEAGGLMSYTVNQIAMYRRTADFVAKILDGAKPADLPVEQASKFDLVINLKTAKALGLEIPPLFLARADEVIE